MSLSEFRKHIKDDHRTEIKNLETPNTLFALYAIASTVLAIALVPVVFQLSEENVFVYLVLFVLMGALQHRLAIIQHESVHYNVFKIKRANIILGNLFCYCLGMNFSNSRVVHMSHHAGLGQDSDLEKPDYVQMFENRREVLLWLLKKLLLIDSILRVLEIVSGIVSRKKSDVASSNPSRSDLMNHFAGLLGTMITQSLLLALYATIHWAYYFLFWLLPVLTITRLIIGFRTITEHSLRTEQADSGERYFHTFHCSKVEQFVFGPLGFNYHGEHHLFPNIPCWNLSRCAQLLRKDAGCEEAMNIKNSYLQHFYRVYLG